MSSAASLRCLPFLVASPDDQTTLRFKICDVDKMVPIESQKARVERLLAVDLAIADDGSFVETTDGLSANELKNLYNALNKLDPTGKRIVYSVSNVTSSQGTTVYRISYMLIASRQVPPPPPAPSLLPPLPVETPEDGTESMAPSEADDDLQHQNRGLRGSLVSLFTSPTKLRTALPRSRKLRGRHSHGDYSTASEASARDSTISLSPSTTSRSIADFRNLINAPTITANPGQAPNSGGAQTMSRSPSVQSYSGLLTPSYTPGIRASASSLAPPSSFPAHLTAKSAVSVSSSGSSSTFRASTTSLVQSPFENSPMVSNVHPLMSAPDALYHQVRRPNPPDYRSTMPRPSNSSLRTTSSMDSSASTIRSGSATGAAERSQTPTGPAAIFVLGNQEVTTAMPRFESLGPMFDRQQSPIHLVAGPTETTWVGLYIPSDHAFGSPNDDPRFVMYGKNLSGLIGFKGKYTPDMSRLAFTTRRFADGSERDSVSVSTTGGASATSYGGLTPSSDTVNTELTMPFTNFDKPAILAATIERWVGQLTSQLDYEELLKFFYIYRSYISPFELLHILIYRFQWTLTPSSDDKIAPEGVTVEPELTHWKEDGAIKRIVRARTCVVLRYWLSTFFVIDFLKNRRLGLMMTNWLNMVSRSKLLDKLPDAKAMLGLVKDLVRQSKINYYEDGRACTPPEERMIGEWDGNSVPLSPELLDMSPVLAMLIADDDPSRTDPRNPDVDLDFTLPLPKADIAHLKPSDDGFHEEEADGPPPPPLTPYQRAYLRAGIHAPTMPGQMVSSMIPHGGRLTIQQANVMSPLHIADPSINPDATLAETGTSYVSKHHSKMERAVVNTLGRLSQWKNMLNPRSPFTSQPLQIVGQIPRSSTAFMWNATASTLGGTGTIGKWTGSGGYAPQHRSPLRSFSAQEEKNEDVHAESIGQVVDDGSVPIPVIDVHAPVVEEEDAAEEPAPAAEHVEDEPAADPSAPLADSAPEADIHPLPELPVEADSHPLPALPVDVEAPRTLSPRARHSDLDIGSDADVEDDEDYGEVANIFTARRGLRHIAPFEQTGAGVAPLSAFDRSRFDTRDSTASWASSISSFGQVLPRRSFSEVVKPPPAPAPRAPPGLPPGLEGFIEQEDYSSSDSDPDDDGEDSEKERRQRVPANSHAKVSSRVSLRREFRMAEEEAQRQAAAAEERRARRAGLRGSVEAALAAAEDANEDDDSPLLAPDEKPRAWHFAPIHKDDEEDVESGDAETALRRLEGAVDPEIARAKAERLDAMIKRAKERTKAVEAGVDFSLEDQLADAAFLAWVAEEEALEEAEQPVEEPPLTVANPDPEPDPAPQDELELATPVVEAAVVEQPADPEQETDDVSSESEGSANHANAPTFTPEFPVPTGIAVTLERFPGPGAHTGWLPFYDVPGPHDAPKLTHKRSWIMDYRSDALARHFSIIDRDLLKNLQFDQIVSLEWARAVPEITVYDWEWFIKWDAERKAKLNEAPYRNVPTISSVSACRARFNLVLMWTATEIVLTPASDRPSLVDKFIRLASKLHQQNSFASLVGIMLGLQSQPVARAMRRHWHRIGAWELRMLKELISFTAPAGNYRKIRETIAQLAARRWMVPQATVTTTDRDGQTVLENAKPSCVPFIYAYLGELHDHSLLPDFIDPTCFEEPYSAGQPLRKPGAFAMLPELPTEVPLRPLVNVGKQRLIANVVRDIVAGQQLALNYTLADVEGEIFIKCMTLRALAPEQLDDLTAKM